MSQRKHDVSNETVERGDDDTARRVVPFPSLASLSFGTCFSTQTDYMPARLDIMLSVQDYTEFANAFDTIRSLIFKNKKKTSKDDTPSMHVSLVSDIKIADAFKDCFKFKDGKVVSTEFKEATAAAIANALGNHAISFKRDPDHYRLLGKATVNQAFLAAPYEPQMFHDELTKPDRFEKLVSSMRVFGFPNLSIVFGVLRSIPMFKVVEYMEQQKKQLLLPFKAVDNGPETRMEVNISDNGSCLFDVPDYEKGLFISRKADTWLPHVSLFKLDRVDQGFSPTLDANRNKQLSSLDVRTRRQIVYELSRSLLNVQLPENMVFDARSIAQHMEFSVKQARVKKA